ncbi:MAG: peptidase U32 family protein [Bacilli bacterium]
MPADKENFVELLAPARDCGVAREAILAGADAVYIGASDFGARAAAANRLDDISQLCKFAHVFGCKVYVALNTILTDAELRAPKI